MGYSTVNGRNNDTLKKRLEFYNISTDHFVYKKPKTDWTDEEIFCENSKVSQSKLRRTFKERELIPYECSICGLKPFWNGKSLTLTLDHKNGKHKDNRIENLRWVCPNCDRQLDTFGMKNKKDLEKGKVIYTGNYEYEQDDIKQDLNDKPIKQNKDKKKRRKNNKENILEIPKREDLKSKLWELKNYTQVANYYNVSPTQIRRWCRKYDLPATINIVKHTSEIGWETENWNDDYKENVFTVELSKPCYMIDKDTNEILKEFSSRNEAVRYLGITANNAAAHISAVCNGKRKTAYGYKWCNKD